MVAERGRVVELGMSGPENAGEIPGDIHTGNWRRGSREPEARRKAMLKLALDWLAREFDGRYLRQCPICGHRGPFAPYRERLDARCPSCDSRAHHRLFKLWLDQELPLRTANRVLHFAPEPNLVAILKPLAAEYVTADIDASRADRALDITALDLADASFDAVICHQVLEHVDDALALAEVWRVLAPGGWAVFTTPVEEGWAVTWENPEAISRRDRQLHHGQGDHLRLYGRDIRDRIRKPGFLLEEFIAVEPQVSAHALERGTRLFIARKPDRAQGPAPQFQEVSA